MKKPAKKPLIVTIMALAFLAALSFARFKPTERLYFNFTESMPRGLYYISSTDRVLTPGDIILFNIPPSITEFAKTRPWLAPYKILLKEVAGISGNQYCLQHGIFTINNTQIGAIEVNDSAGDPLPQLEMCGTVQSNHILVVGSASKHSFDSRYFGEISTNLMIGKAKALITF